MSAGRKNVSKTFRSKGVKTENIIGNLTQAGGRGNTILKNENFKFRDNLGLQSRSKAHIIGENAFNRGETAKAQFDATVTKLSDEQIGALNIRFQQRAGELLSRNSFQGRNQLILTDRA